MTVSIEQAQLKLAELIQQGKPGEAISIEHGGQVVADLVVRKTKRGKRKLGSLKGKIHFVGDPFDKSHLEDFKEYM